MRLDLDTNTILIAGSGVVGGLLGYMTLVEPFRIQVKEFELTFPNLPPAFDGFTLLHLSDLHITKLGLLEKRTMEIVSRRPVDICLITGDVTARPARRIYFDGCVQRSTAAVPYTWCSATRSTSPGWTHRCFLTRCRSRDSKC